MIYSMTAFARCSARGDWGHATCELRSVNHRYLDVGIRTPESLRALETKMREFLREQIQRGKVECQFRFTAGEAVESDIQVNHRLVKQLLNATTEVEGMLDKASAVRPFDILRWPDVLQTGEIDKSQLEAAVMPLLQETTKEFIAARQREGQALHDFLQQRLQKISQQVQQLVPQLPEFLHQQRDKIMQRFAEAKVELDSERLEQEMVMLAQRSDVAEELDRLQAHIAEVERVLQQGGPVGRRLDFLMQEMNREANTLASKSISTVITQTAIELKVLIEQMREQIQNIE